MKNLAIVFVCCLYISCNSRNDYVNGVELDPLQQAALEIDPLAIISKEVNNKFGVPYLMLFLGQTNTSILQIFKINNINDSIKAALIYYLPIRDSSLPKIFKIEERVLESTKILKTLQALEMKVKKGKVNDSNRNMGGTFFRLEKSSSNLFSKNTWISEGDLSSNAQIATEIDFLFTSFNFKPLYKFNESDFHSLVSEYLPDRIDSLKNEIKLYNMQ